MNFISSRWVIGTFVGVALGLASMSPAAAKMAAPAPSPTTAYGTVALSAATVARTTFYVAPPASLKTAGGVPFTLGNAYWMHFGDQPVTLSMNFDKPQAVYLLLNTSYTDAAFAGQTAGTVRLTFSDGTVRDTALVVSSNIREWEYGISWTANTLSSPSTASVWQGQGQAAQGGGMGTIDMLTIPAISTAHLTGVTVSDTNNNHLGIVLQGLTVLYDPTVVTPVVSDENGDHDNQVGHQDKDKGPKHTVGHKPGQHQNQSGKHGDNDGEPGDGDHHNGGSQGERD